MRTHVQRESVVRALSQWGLPGVALLVGLALVLHAQDNAGLQRWALLVHALWIMLAIGLRFVTRSAELSDEQRERKHLLSLCALVLPLVAYLFSPAIGDRWFYFLKWSSTAVKPLPAAKTGWFRFLMLTIILTPLFIKRLRRLWVVVLAVLVVMQIVCLTTLHRVTGGAALYNDDHSSFMFRLWVFGRTFPQYIYYNPLWNGGKAAPFLIASGTLTPGLLLWPLWRFGVPDQVYTPALAFFFIFLVPLMAAGATRSCGGTRSAACCAGLLALCVSRYFFLWLLHFGTLGSCLSLAFIMLVCAALYRVLWLGRRGIWTGVALVVGAFFFVAWPPAVIMTAPILLAVLASARRWTLRNMAFLAACGLVLIILHLPLLGAMLSHTDPAGFAQPAQEGQAWTEVWTEGWRELADHFRQAHPLLVFLGLAGCFFLPQRGLRCFFGVAMLGLAAFAAWGDLWMPSLALDRAAIPLLFLAAIPAGFAIAAVWEKGSPWFAPVRAGLLALLVLGAYNGRRLYGNQTDIGRYKTLGEDVRAITSWLADNTPENGRVLFAGAALHAFGRGHVAYLPVMTGREMMAADYYHFSPKRVEYNYPPRAFREEDEDVHAFMELYNVTHLVTFHGNWMRFCKRNRDLYEQVKVFGRKRKIKIYRVKRGASCFEKGSGRVEAGINYLRVALDQPEQEIVLKYNWEDGLAATPPVELSPYGMTNDVHFIAVHPHGEREFTIRYRWKPFRKGT